MQPVHRHHFVVPLDIMKLFSDTLFRDTGFAELNCWPAGMEFGFVRAPIHIWPMAVSICVFMHVTLASHFQLHRVCCFAFSSSFHAFALSVAEYLGFLVCVRVMLCMRASSCVCAPVVSGFQTVTNSRLRRQQFQYLDFV